MHLCRIYPNYLDRQVSANIEQCSLADMVCRSLLMPKDTFLHCASQISSSVFCSCSVTITTTCMHVLHIFSFIAICVSMLFNKLYMSLSFFFVKISC